MWFARRSSGIGSSRPVQFIHSEVFMNSSLRRLSTMTLAAPLLLAGGLAAHADGPDTAAPVVADYSVTSDDGDDDLAYFIEQEPATFTVRVHITDETGLDRTSGLFNPPSPVITVSSTDTDQSVGFGGMELVSGDAMDGWYEKTITIPEGRAPGEWEVTIYPLDDTLGNRTEFGDFAMFGTLGIVEVVYGTPATPANVVFNDSERTYTIPSTGGVEYLLDGEVVEPGTYDASGTVAVTARALNGFVLDGEFEWKHSFAAQTVTPEAVTFSDQSGTARDTYTVPSTEYVEYLVDGEVVEAGTYSAFGDVSVTARAVDGYELTGTSTWSNSFTSKTPFIDVTPGVEHYDAMMWMYDSGLSTGWKTSSGPEYRALSPVNRDAMAAFLYRQAGSPDVTLPSTSPFTDMRPTQEHYKAVVWAYQEGITTGWTMSDGTRQFRPVRPIARDAMAAFLYRFAGEPAYSMPDGKCFADVPHSTMYAKEMCWMKSSGVSKGWRDGTYRPLQPVKRDAMAAFLQRYDAMG
ncbi:S-layer homology domain-containing protein [Brachybacterium sp. GCM10030268]|uniref:S-layer homology domain-containing protein n=1 Tax=Brachybacterium sp. GCM10030268 TaxID=3273382 RepID=UPI003615992C